jgi:proteasome accessory factor A
MTQTDPIAAAQGKSSSAADRLPKVCGGDLELGNFILGLQRSGGTSFEASRALLAEIKGVAHSYSYSVSPSNWHTEKASGSASGDGYGGGWSASGGAWDGGYSGGNYGSGYSNCGYNCQDWGRKFLPSNGGCVYIDLGHLEICLPEVVSAFDHVAATHAMLRIVREAMNQANARLPEGQKIQVLVNNSDGQGNSYGSHQNFMVTRRCFDDLFHRKLHQMLYLAAHQISGIVYTGAGKVGSENGRPDVDFQISQRADFYETLTGVQTTHDRPVVNSRDESLCGGLGQPGLGGGGEDRMARLHVIFFDNTLCHVSGLLKIGVTQIILAMIEQGVIQPGLLLDNPLLALRRWSHDPTLQHKARLVCGKDYTAVEVQLSMAEAAGRFLAAGRAEGIVPRAEEIFKLWTETLEQLKRQDVGALSGKLDWVLKRSILEQAIGGNGLRWNSPQIKYLDQMYSSLDWGEGLYWEMERAGAVGKLVTDAQVEHFVHEPPPQTRAYTRAMVLRQVAADSVVSVDWDDLRLKFSRKDGGCWAAYFDLPMHNPLGFNKSQYDLAMEMSANLPEAMKRLGMRETTYFGQPLPAAEQPRTSIVGSSSRSGAR